MKNRNNTDTQGNKAEGARKSANRHRSSRGTNNPESSGEGTARQTAEKAMDFFESIKSDISKLYDEGMELAKKSSDAIMKGANTLTEEGKRMYQVLDLKIKAKAQMTELGGTVYRLSKKVENPMGHPRVKAIRNRIAKFEKKIQQLEGKGNKKTAKKAP